MSLWLDKDFNTNRIRFSKMDVCFCTAYLVTKCYRIYGCLHSFATVNKVNNFCLTSKMLEIEKEMEKQKRAQIFNDCKSIVI